MVYLASDTQHMKAIFFYQSMKLFVQVGLYYYQNSIPKLYLESSQFQNSQLYLAQHTRNLSLNYRVSHTNNVHHVFYSISHIHPKVSWNRIKLTCIPLFMGYHFRKSRKKV